MTREHGIEYLNQPGYIGETWNVGYGCKGCELGRDCWALGQIPRQAKNCPASTKTWRHGKHSLEWTGEWISLAERLEEPLHWKAPRFVAVEFMGDISLAPAEYFAAVLGVVAATPHHMYLLLSKWPEVIRERLMAIPENIGAHLGDSADRYIQSGDGEMAVWVSNYVNGWSMPRNIPNDGNPCNGTVKRWPLPNLILGTSATNQGTLETRWRELAQIPARWRVISVTPRERLNAETLPMFQRGHLIKPDLIIVDGKSGPRATPTNLDDIRALRDQCRELGIGFRLKQAGSSPCTLGNPVCEFSSYNEWVTHARSWLGGISGGGVRYKPRERVVCFDVQNRICHVGADFMRADREGAFPVRALEIVDSNFRHPSGGDLSEWPEDLRIREWLW